MDEVTGVAPERHIVQLANARELAYDYLILATGAAYSLFGHEEWRAHARVLKSLRDALAIRAEVLGAFERAEQAESPEEARRLLTFVIVGGGPTGVELAGTLAELARSTLARVFRHIDPRSTRILLCEAGPRVLASFPESLSGYAADALRTLGVELRLGQSVTAIGATGLMIGDERIETRNVLWCAGTAARPAARWLGVEAARNGAVKVLGDCPVPGYPKIFAIGDVASHDDGSGKPLPGLAPVAEQQGRYVGGTIKARLAGRADPVPFHYHDLGTMAVIGRSRAVADFGWMRLTGFFAWLTWSLVHLMLLVDFRSRLAVYLNWTWAWFSYGRGKAPDAGRPGEAGGRASGVGAEKTG